MEFQSRIVTKIHACQPNLRVISGRADVSSLSSPISVNELAFLSQKFVSMSSKVITLCLQQVCWQPLRAIAIVEGQSRRQARHWNSPKRRVGHDLSPRVLVLDHCGLEEIVQQEVRQLWVAHESLFDVAQEHASNDAASAPHQGDAAVVQVPAIFLGSFAHQHEALLMKFVDE